MENSYDVKRKKNLKSIKNVSDDFPCDNEEQGILFDFDEDSYREQYEESIELYNNLIKY